MNLTVLQIQALSRLVRNVETMIELYWDTENAPDSANHYGYSGLHVAVPRLIKWIVLTHPRRSWSSTRTARLAGS